MSRRTPAPQGFHDFDLLPRHTDGSFVVLPTPVKLLYQGGDVLVYREVRRTDTSPLGISKSQHRLFQNVTREDPDSSGCRFTVLCVHGLPGEPREICLYDHTGGNPHGPVWVDAPEHAAEEYIRDWFVERSRR